MDKPWSLNEREYDVLSTLRWVNHGSSHPRPWARPLDLGGMNGTHHSATLAKLEGHGLVQSKQRGAADPAPGELTSTAKQGRSRGSKAYRITAKGVGALKP
jgi:hypothetical protein